MTIRESLEIFSELERLISNLSANQQDVFETERDYKLLVDRNSTRKKVEADEYLKTLSLSLEQAREKLDLDYKWRLKSIEVASSQMTRKLAYFRERLARLCTRNGIKYELLPLKEPPMLGSDSQSVQNLLEAIERRLTELERTY